MVEGEGPSPSIEVEGLSVTFGKVRALNDISLQVGGGEIFGVVGTNGAGKSTLIDVLSGIVKPSSGKVRVAGMDPIRQAAKLRSMIGVVSQETSLEEKLTTCENLEYFGRLLDVPKEDLRGKVDQMVRFMGLWDRRNDRLESYSVGMKRKVHFACSLIHDPKVLLVDEATAGFDPAIKREVSKLIVEMSRTKGITVMLTTHDLTDARSICDRLAVIHRGRIISTGTWDEIASGSDARLVVKGISAADGDRLRGLVASDRVLDILGGFEIIVESVSDAFEVVQLLEKKDVHASAISFEVPTDEMFERLTADSEDGSNAR